MNDFDWDAHQKKLIAQGAKHKKRARKGCTLPSDYMTPAQKKKQNGAVKTMALNKPITWDELEAMPEDIQREYINGLRDKYQANDDMIGKMLGKCGESLRQKRLSLGGEWVRLPTRVPVKDAMARAELWDEFLGREPLSEQIEKLTEKEPEKSPVRVRSKMAVKIAGAESWEEIMEALKAYPSPKGMVVDIYMREENGDEMSLCTELPNPWYSVQRDL